MECTNKNRMYRMAFGGIIVILLTVICYATEKSTLYTADNDLNELTCSGNDILLSKQNVSRVMCSTLCDNMNQCIGFTFRSSDGKCVGCKGGPARIVSADPGMVFFGPIGERWGSSCTAQYACTSDNQQCMDGLCVCVPGYSFNFNSWTCVTSCDSYGDTFQKYPRKGINTHNLKCVNFPTLEQCFQDCLDTPSCITLDYGGTHNMCCLHAVTPLDVPGSFIESSNYDFYTRNC